MYENRSPPVQSSRKMYLSMIDLRVRSGLLHYVHSQEVVVVRSRTYGIDVGLPGVSRATASMHRRDKRTCVRLSRISTSFLTLSSLSLPRRLMHLQATCLKAVVSMAR